MCEKIPLGAFSVRVQGIIDYSSKIRRRCGRRLSHECEKSVFEDDGVVVGQRAVPRYAGTPGHAACQVTVTPVVQVFLGKIELDDRRGITSITSVT